MSNFPHLLEQESCLAGLLRFLIRFSSFIFTGDQQHPKDLSTPMAECSSLWRCILFMSRVACQNHHQKTSLTTLMDLLSLDLCLMKGYKIPYLFSIEITLPFFQSPNAALQPIISALSSITGYGDSTPFTSFDLGALISPAIGGRYATYEGGLTTPTCNEVVRWINMETPLEISAEQLAAFR